LKLRVGAGEWIPELGLLPKGGPRLLNTWLLVLWVGGLEKLFGRLDMLTGKRRIWANWDKRWKIRGILVLVQKSYDVAYQTRRYQKESTQKEMRLPDPRMSVDVLGYNSPSGVIYARLETGGGWAKGLRGKPDTFCQGRGVLQPRS